MSIASQISRIKGNLAAAYDICEAKGATLPSAQNSANLASTISNISSRESVSWHQCPLSVQNYLNHILLHPYSPGDYSDSCISEFAPAVPDQSNTKPVGVTVDGVSYYDNEPLVAVPFSGVSRAGTLTALDRLRWYHTVTANVRDLGGWSCDGGTVKYGMLVRGGLPKAADKELMADKIGIKTELQLYGGSDDQYHYDKYSLWGIDWYGADGYIWYSISDAVRDLWKYDLRVIFDSVIHHKPVFFHCGAGKDRTGTVAVMLLGILGVSQSNIDADYELTSFATGSGSGITTRTTEDYRNYISAISSVPLVGGLSDSFRNRCISYALSLGFTADEINAFRTACISGAPETISPNLNEYTIIRSGSHISFNDQTASVEEFRSYSVDLKPDAGYVIADVLVLMDGSDISGCFTGKKTLMYHGVSRELTNCSIDRRDTWAMDNQSFVAELMPDSGFTLEGANVTITMGGINVSSFYSNGKIAIPNVTGNIVITATAIPSAPVNLFDASSSDNYTPKYRFNGSNQIVTLGLAHNNGITHLIPCSEGDSIRVSTDLAASSEDISNGYSYVAVFYDSAETPQTRKSAYSYGECSPDNKEWTFTVPSGSHTHMRIALPYTDLTNIIITAES